MQSIWATPADALKNDHGLETICDLANNFSVLKKFLKQFKNEKTCGQHAATTNDLVQLSLLIDRFRLLVRLRQD